MHEKDTFCTDIHHGFNVDLLWMAYSVFLLWQFYGERSITVTLSRTVFINSDCFPSSNNFIWLTVFLFNSKIYKLLGRSDGLQHTCCSFFCNCRLWLIAWPFFSRKQSLPFLRHLLLILSCLIRDLGGSSRSLGCEDDKWIARLEKWTQIHPLLEYVFTSMHCSSSRIMDGMVATSRCSTEFQ